MEKEYLEPLPDNKVVLAEIELDSYNANKIIAEEYKVGWVVQQIIYIEHRHEIMILFKRKD